MALSGITRAAVLAAIAEFDELGRDAFLAKYRFGSARRYLVRHQGRLYDSKAIAGAAHGFLPGRSPLTNAEFSGGAAAGQAARVLRDLGFEIPDEGDAALTAEMVGRIAKMETATADGRPMLKQGVVLLWAVGCARAAEPRLLGWAETRARLVPLLEQFRRTSERERGRPDFPIAALQRAGLWEMVGLDGIVPPAHGDSALKNWFESYAQDGGLPARYYHLARRSGEARIRIIEAVLDKYFDDFDDSGLLAAVGLYDEHVAEDEPTEEPAADGIDVDGSADAEAKYTRLCALVEHREQETSGKRRTTLSGDLVRLSTARSAVLLRSGGRCENPACGRPAPDVTDLGWPILEVDHIEPIADGGRDHPIQMIALCPNCHAVKTRGRNRERLAAELAAAAEHLHKQWGTQ